MVSCEDFPNKTNNQKRVSLWKTTMFKNNEAIDQTDGLPMPISGT